MYGCSKDPMKTKLLILAAILTALVGVWVGKVAWRASHDLVTLDVRDMDVRKVVKKIERQTWETILLPSDLQGKVTLNVRNAPLTEILEMVAGQVSARSSHVIPIYRTKKALRQLHSLVERPTTNQVRSEVWTNFFARGRFGMEFRGFGGPGGGFGPDEPTNSLISMNLVSQDASVAARMLSSSTRARVVVEDGLQKPIFLFVTNATPEAAALKLAEKLNAKVDEFYLLQTFSRDGGPRARREGGETNSVEEPFRRGPGPEMMAARLAEMTPEQRTRMEAMRNLTPEERQAQMQARMEDPALQQRMADRAIKDLRSSTPEQIVQQKRERMRRMQNGPGGGTNGMRRARPI